MLSHIMENSEKINEFEKFKEYLTLAIILSFEAGIFFVFAFTTINIIFSILFYILSFNLIIVSLFYCRKSKKLFLNIK